MIKLQTDLNNLLNAEDQGRYAIIITMDAMQHSNCIQPAVMYNHW